MRMRSNAELVVLNYTVCRILLNADGRMRSNAVRYSDWMRRSNADAVECGSSCIELHCIQSAEVARMRMRLNADAVECECGRI